MYIKSKWSIPIPAVDILSYIFDENYPEHGNPVWINAEDPSEKLIKPEMKILVKKLGKGLLVHHDLKQGDRVMICAQNSIYYPVMYLGTLCAGGIFCGSNPSSQPPELVRNLEIATPKILFTDLAAEPLVSKALDLYGGARPAIYLIEDKEEYGSHIRYKHVSDLLQSGEHEWEKLHDLKAVSERVALLAFSSGTTGLPKACAISHYNLVASTEQKFHIETLHMSPKQKHNYALEHRFCAYLPMYHATGMITNIQHNSKTGASTFVLSGFTLNRMIRAVQKHQVTDLLIVPPVATLMFKSGLDLTKALSSVRNLVTGAAPLGAESGKKLKTIFTNKDFRLQQAYGMTEVSGAATLFHDDESDGVTVGHLIASMEAKIVDEHGATVLEGEAGELLLRGPNVFLGYWRNDAATRQAKTADGWLRTGDIVTISQEGVFSVIGRNKEIIKVKGFQVAPAELESILLSSSYVKDCAIIGVKRNGFECPQAHIVPTSPSITERHILAFLNGKISSYKELTGGVYFTESIPKSQSGKILRRMIKDPLVSRHGSASKL